MAKFELGSVLAEALGNVPETDTRERIEYLPLSSLVYDERNFYSIDGVEELAANIELVGLQQPLRVLRGEDPFYVIVSGHRRAAALRILAEEDPERWKTVPCIVERPAASPEMEELRLIYANADTRRMTSADQAKQAERVSELLYALKEQGVEFPGRMRDHVAEVCKINKTKLAELKVIREKLSKDWTPYWQRNEISHACAYKIAQQPDKVQRQLFLATVPEHQTEWRVDRDAQTIRALMDRPCIVSKNEVSCFYAPTLVTVALGPGYHGCSSYRCCKECPNLITCKDSCPNVADVKGEKKAAQKAKRAEEIKAEKARSAELEGITRKIWTRFGELRRAKGMSAKEITEARGDQFYASYHGEEWQEQMEGPDAKITEHTAVPWTNSMQADDVEKLVKTADAFGCSCDYLLGRTDEKEPSAALISVDDRYPKEGQYVMAFTRWLVPVPSVFFRAAFMDCTEKSVGNTRLKGIEFWAPMPRLPDGKKWPGQETIEELTEKRST